MEGSEQGPAVAQQERAGTDAREAPLEHEEEFLH